ncbi:Zinc knuckle family protein [Panicum miliaceum]|uniref:Zinc knuckle family protein n=1 Tax=Panicum miliaceum TaxID=4540 RepID=A0A3L6S131_PANMI|nr:Zinc knuckle family protein [Panicum miliaceum]
MDSWLILQNFYNGLTPTARDHIDAAAGGAFFSLTIDRTKTLMEKMVSNQGWNDERLQPRQRGMHSVKETDMIAAKLDLLLKNIDEHPQERAPTQVLQALDSRMTCEVCGNIRHSGNDCPETQEDVMYMNNNNGFHPQGGQGWNQSCPYYQGGNGNSNSFNPNQPSLRDLVLSQAKTNEAIQKKPAANDKTLETIQAKMDGISSTLKNQLSFNKMFETQLAQLAAAVPSAETGKILG